MTTAGRPKILEALDAYGPRPVWRGRVHFLAALVAAPAALVLFLVAPGPMAKVAVTIYAVSLVGLFAVSASYHRLAHTETAVKWFRRADHSMIFVLIAGTYTPLCLLALPPAWGIPLLVAVWVAAIGGVITKMTMLGRGPGSAGSWLYIVIGWAAVVAVPALVTNLDALQLVLLAVGGLLYTVGAIVLGKRWPDPVPHVFGYHEVWHSMTVAAGSCHFAVVALVLIH
ncbi:MAG TPA: hemolysin III family protein [Microthrixaceae bacterium]|nr:hemolysin III family protein [Microthrixaceae bacterium]